MTRESWCKKEHLRAENKFEKMFLGDLLEIGLVIIMQETSD